MPYSRQIDVQGRGRSVLDWFRARSPVPLRLSRICGSGGSRVATPGCLVVGMDEDRVVRRVFLDRVLCVCPADLPPKGVRTSKQLS